MADEGKNLRMEGLKKLAFAPRLSPKDWNVRSDIFTLKIVLFRLYYQKIVWMVRLYVQSEEIL